MAQDRLNTIRPSIEVVVDDRFGGLWIEWTHPSSIFSVAVVRPTQGDVDRLDELAKRVGWMVRVHAVRYSSRELEEFTDRLIPLMSESESDAWLSLGWSPQSNKVEAELSKLDVEMIRTIAAMTPEDAVAVKIAPGFKYVPLSEAAETLNDGC